MNNNNDCRSTADEWDSELLRRIEEFQHQQSRWEVQRNAEQEHLEQTARQLSDAWLALEDEQRSLLRANSGSVLVSPGNVARQVQPVGVIPVPVATAPEPVQAAQPRPVPSVNTRVSIPNDLVPRDVAVRQFEKLRNEIQSTRR